MAVPFADMKIKPEVLEFEGPFYYAHYQRIEINNDSFHKVYWLVKKRCSNNEIIIEPQHGILKGKEIAFVDVVCNRVVSDKPQDDELIFQWVEVPSDSPDVFDSDEFKRHSEMSRRKSVSLKYTQPEPHTPNSIKVEQGTKENDDRLEEEISEVEEEIKSYKFMVRMKNPSKYGPMYWVAKPICKSYTIEPNHGFLQTNESIPCYVTVDRSKCTHKNGECGNLSVDWAEVSDDAPKIFSVEQFNTMSSITKHKEVAIDEL